MRIGPENETPEFSDCSVVTATYRVGDHTAGTMGIIGPTRMDYSRVVTVLGFMGRTGYSDRENVNNIETVHLHFGLQLIFDESQKDCDNEIWIDVYDIVELLSRHRSSVRYDRERSAWTRVYPYRDLDG